MTTERTVRVGPKGQVVIPKAIRDELGIRAGEQVRVGRAGDEVRVRPLLPLGDLRGVFADAEGGTSDLEREHRRERAREDASAEVKGLA